MTARGALRDMVQNHLMQLLAITAMEPPAKFDKDGFRNEVIKVYQSLHPLTDEYIRENVIRGQYVAGETQAGYREEKNVNPDSRTDNLRCHVPQDRQLALARCAFLYPNRQADADQGD